MLDRLLPTKYDYESIEVVFHANKIQHNSLIQNSSVRSNRDVDRQGVMEHNDYTEAFHIVSNYMKIVGSKVTVTTSFYVQMVRWFLHH